MLLLLLESTNCKKASSTMQRISVGFFFLHFLLYNTPHTYILTRHSTQSWRVPQSNTPRMLWVSGSGATARARARARIKQNFCTHTDIYSICQHRYSHIHTHFSAIYRDMIIILFLTFVTSLLSVRLLVFACRYFACLCQNFAISLDISSCQ